MVIENMENKNTGNNSDFVFLKGMDVRDDDEIVASVIESLLFISGEPLSLGRIAGILEIDKKRVKQVIDYMKETYKDRRRGIMLREINGCCQLCTKPENYDYTKKLSQSVQKNALSQAAYETLAIIAYNRPITKAEIDEIRGVNSESAITKLLDRNLIRKAGHVNSPGKPALYEPTEEFLKCFGLDSYDDLPPIDNI
jgi:segregation and condensation protein B